MNINDISDWFAENDLIYERDWYWSLLTGSRSSSTKHFKHQVIVPLDPSNDPCMKITFKRKEHSVQFKLTML